MPPPTKKGPGPAAYVSMNPGMGGTTPAVKTKSPEQIAKEKSEDEAALKAFYGDQKPVISFGKDPSAPMLTPEQQAEKLRQQEAEQLAILKQQAIQDHMNEVERRKLEWLAQSDAENVARAGSTPLFGNAMRKYAENKHKGETREQALARADAEKAQENAILGTKRDADSWAKAHTPGFLKDADKRAAAWTAEHMPSFAKEALTNRGLSTKPNPNVSVGYNPELDSRQRQIRDTTSFVRDTSGNQKYIGEKELERQKIMDAIEAAKKAGKK